MIGWHREQVIWQGNVIGRGEIGRRRGGEGDLRGMLAGLGYFGAAGTGRRVEAVVLAARLNQWSKEVLHGIR